MNWPETEVTLVADFASAFEAITRQPDLCLCDLSMPGAKPRDGIRKLRSLSKSTTILVVTASEDDDLLVDLFREGIAGFIPKTSRTALIERAIRVTLVGGQYVPARVLELVPRRETSGVHNDASGTEALSRLTIRQIEVLRFVAKGRSNKEIAGDLGLSPAPSRLTSLQFSRHSAPPIAQKPSSSQNGVASSKRSKIDHMQRPQEAVHQLEGGPKPPSPAARRCTGRSHTRLHR